MMVMQRYQYDAHEVVRRMSRAGGLRPFDEEPEQADGLALSKSERQSHKGYRLASFDLIRTLERGVAAQLRRLVDEGLLFGDVKLPNILVDLDKTQLARTALSDFGVQASAAAASGGREPLRPVDAHCPTRWASRRCANAATWHGSLRDERIATSPVRRHAERRGCAQWRASFAAPVTALCALYWLTTAARDGRGRALGARCAEQRITSSAGWTMLPASSTWNGASALLPPASPTTSSPDGRAQSRRRVLRTDGQKLWLALESRPRLGAEGLAIGAAAGDAHGTRTKCTESHSTRPSVHAAIYCRRRRARSTAAGRTQVCAPPDNAVLGDVAFELVR